MIPCTIVKNEEFSYKSQTIFILDFKQYLWETAVGASLKLQQLLILLTPACFFWLGDAPVDAVNDWECC